MLRKYIIVHLRRAPKEDSLGQIQQGLRGEEQRVNEQGQETRNEFIIEADLWESRRLHRTP